jgi:hypothetical protein
MTPMAKEILTMVRKKRHVSFAELQKIEGFAGAASNSASTTKISCCGKE